MPGVGGRSFLGGGVPGPRPERPELRGDCTFSGGAGARKGQIPMGIAVCLVFFLRFSFSVAFVSLSGCVFRWLPESAYHGGILERVFGGFWAAFGGLMGQAGTPERPDTSGDCRFLVFLLLFSFSVAFVSLLGWVFRWFPESAYHGGILEGFLEGSGGLLGGLWKPGTPERHWP